MPRRPRILEPGEVEALMGSLRTTRDRAMVQTTVLGGRRRCEVLGLRLEDLRLGEWRVFIAEGKGGHQRLVPVSQSFLATVASYLNNKIITGAGVSAGIDLVLEVVVKLNGPETVQSTQLLIEDDLAWTGKENDVVHDVQKVRLSSGCEVAVRTAGDASEPAIVLLHGFPSSSRTFRDVMVPLSGSVHVVAPDLPGFGESDLPPRAVGREVVLA